MADRCALSDLLVDECACRVHTPAKDPDDLTPTSTPFPAQFPGYCRTGHDRIEVGDQIVHLTDGYSHQECP